MCESHIGLLVTHLPRSCSFFLSALQPLGYRFIHQEGDSVGFGIDDAEFYLCQETPGYVISSLVVVRLMLTRHSYSSGAAHIVFSAPCRLAVRDFYTAALNAGGYPHGGPATRNADVGLFNAAVLDFDGNSVEVAYQEVVDSADNRSNDGSSRVLSWQKDVASSLSDVKSEISTSTIKTLAKSIAPSMSGRSQAPSMVRTVSEPIRPSRTAVGDHGAKKLIGTLLGAAAGAAVAYAMCRSEEDSAKSEAAFSKSQERPRKQIVNLQDPALSRIVHRNMSDIASDLAHYAQRAIAAGPANNYRQATYTSVAPSLHERQAIEYGSRPVPATKSTYESYAPDPHDAKELRYLPAPPTRRRSADDTVSEHSHHSSRSRSRSVHSNTSKHSSRRPLQRAITLPSTPEQVPSKAPSRAASKPPSRAPSRTRDEPHMIHLIDNCEDVDLKNLETATLAPSDSISNAGSSSRRSHHSHRSASKHGSTHSSHSKSKSRHSHSRHSSSSRKEEKPSMEIIEIVQPDSISEASTVKPPTAIKVKRGSVASLPIRSRTTPSFVGERKKRSVVSYV